MTIDDQCADGTCTIVLDEAIETKMGHVGPQ